MSLKANAFLIKGSFEMMVTFEVVTPFLLFHFFAFLMLIFSNFAGLNLISKPQNNKFK